MSALAAEVQTRRTVSSVLQTAGEGVLRLGMRLYAFQTLGLDVVLRYLATTPARLEAIERNIGRPLDGLRAPAARLAQVDEVVGARRIVHRTDLDLFHSFVRVATGFDPATLEGSPETASINNGVLAPIFVRGEPWGLLGVVSRTVTADDVDAVALFATHVGSALEAAESFETLARAQRELVARERLAALGELAAVVAHEVRNPLCVLVNAVSGIRDFLASGAPAERRGSAEILAAMATEEVDNLTRIASELLDFARPHTPDLRVGSVVPVLQGVACAMPDRRVRVDVAGELPQVAMDASCMRQAFLNLVMNGLQAIDEGGSITVRARAETRDDRRAVRIDVIDTGPGIAASVRERMFTPFVTTKPTGTGLGLAVVKRIVDSHRGELDVESSARGTTFTVRLPAAV